LQSKEVCKQIVLIVHSPASGKAKAFLQPQHRLEAGDGSPRCIEGLKPPFFGMFFFTRKWSLSMPSWRCSAGDVTLCAA
jgi:hypothetical protein